MWVKRTGAAGIFVWGGGTFEAVAGSWRYGSTPAVNRVMSGAPERKKIGEITFGVRACVYARACVVCLQCCHPQIHWYDIPKCR